VVGSTQYPLESDLIPCRTKITQNGLGFLIDQLLIDIDLSIVPHMLQHIEKDMESLLEVLLKVKDRIVGRLMVGQVAQEYHVLGTHPKVPIKAILEVRHKGFHFYMNRDEILFLNTIKFLDNF
jgi:hypothetical protein